MENYEKTFREDIEYERARADKAEARIAEAEAIAKATLVENENLKKILREHNIDI